LLTFINIKTKLSNSKNNKLINLYKAFFIFCFFVANTVAQVNLVPNGSFEMYDTCPNVVNQVHYAIPWFDPTGASSDYFNSCVGTAPSNVGMPNNWAGNQLAFQGNAYCGFGAFDNGSGSINYREYISVPLKDTLIKGVLYCVRFYVNLADYSSFAIKTIGAALSIDSLKATPPLPINVIPNILSTQLIIDTINWVKIEGNYIASGGEKYLTIGNFNSDLNCDVTLIRDTSNYFYGRFSYYYVDSVTLTKCSDNNASFLIPNIFTPNNDGVNDMWFVASNQPILLYIYNRWGNLITKQNANKVFWDGADCSDGVYYYMIETEDKKYKGTIQLIR